MTEIIQLFAGPTKFFIILLENYYDEQEEQRRYSLLLHYRNRWIVC